MKFVKNIIESVKPHFEEGGKLSKFWVVFDSLETFAFTPGHVTHSGSHIRDGIDLKRTMFTVIVALLPALLFGMFPYLFSFAFFVCIANFLPLALVPPAT